MPKAKTMSIDEATRAVQEINNLFVNGIITKEKALAAIKKIPYYDELLSDFCS